MTLFLVAALLAGCATDAPDSDETGEETPAPKVIGEDPWNGKPELLVAVRDVGVSPGFFEFDALCTFGGTTFMDLNGGEIPADTVAFRFEVVSVGPTTGVQAGYQVDGQLTWLPSVTGTSETTRVDVPPGGAPESWLMKYQLNLPEAAQQDCYTGASLGSYSIHIYALKE